MQILLIGNKGQVGRELQELAAEKNIVIHGYDIAELDITVPDAVSKIVATHSTVDAIINAAAYTAVDKAEDESELAYAVNRDGVENLALAAKAYNIPLIHISTDYVFSGDSSTAYLEDAKPAPLGVYGASKLAGEQILQSTWEKHVIVRISWVFGKYGSNFVKTILRLAQERETLGIVGDQYGCPTPAADIARVLLEIAVKVHEGAEKWGTYHYCGKPAVSWYEFAEAIIAGASKKNNLKIQNLNEITSDEYPTRAKRPVNSELLVSKICRDYGIVQREWQSYLQEVIDNNE